MRPTGALQVPVPSSSLLLFLRSQSEQLCLYPPSTATACQRSGASKNRHRPPRVGQCIALQARSSTTTVRRQANIAVSLPDLYFLRPSAKHGPPTLPYNSGGQRPARAIRFHKGEIHRHATTDTRSLLKRLWTPKERIEKPNLKPMDLPPLPNFLDEVGGMTLGRNKTGKAGNELKLRCTEFDIHGNVTLMDGEFKKTELIAKYGLLPRDLRKIDSSLLPHILVRPSAILINLLHLRVLVKSNCVLVLDAYGTTDSFTQSQFIYDLQNKLGQREGSKQSGGLPYEFRAMEAVLISVTTGLEEEFKGVAQPVMRVLQELEEDIDRDKLRHLLIFSKKLGTFEQKARLVRDAIDDLLEADDDLVTMYLSERAQGKIREEDDHTEVEMLLESYHKVCDEIVQAAGNLVSNIRNTEEVVKAILDANRNSLMLLDLKFSIGTLGIGSGAFVASLYGMNLKNFIEESDLGFLGVTAWSFIFAAMVCTYGLKKLRKVQRVSMWGEQGTKSRGTWREVGPTPALPGLPGESRMERLNRLKEAKQEAGGEGAAAGMGTEDVEALLPIVREEPRPKA